MACVQFIFLFKHQHNTLNFVNIPRALYVQRKQYSDCLFEVRTFGGFNFGRMFTHSVGVRLVIDLNGSHYSRPAGVQRKAVIQESCAIAKMTAQCGLHMSALKIFGTP